jgi:hypothetical protein
MDTILPMDPLDLGALPPHLLPALYQELIYPLSEGEALKTVCCRTPMVVLLACPDVAI